LKTVNEKEVTVQGCRIVEILRPCST